MCGLNDVPVAWQLSWHQFVNEELGGRSSKLDENLLYFKDDKKQLKDNDFDCLTGLMASHVDDLSICVHQPWLDELHVKFTKRFKKVTRQQTSFSHCGSDYIKTKQGFKISQASFVEKMVPVVETRKGRDDSDRLTAAESTSFRSILGALWLITSIRLDLVADISFLQGKVTTAQSTAQISDLKKANEVLVKAQQDKDLGLHYRHFQSKHQRLMLIHDASPASQGRHYAQEGVLVILADDSFHGHELPHEQSCSDQDTEMHGGTAHVLTAYGSKAT